VPELRKFSRLWPSAAYLMELISQLQHDLNFEDINFVLVRIRDNGFKDPKKPGLVKTIRKSLMIRS
jgi:hypothetical protein